MNPEIINIIIIVVAGIAGLTGLGAWLVKKGVGIGAGKVAGIAEKSALAINGVAMAAKGAGLEKVGVALEEFADVPDELGDLAAQIELMTKNQDFTKEAFTKLFKEGKDVYVEGKDFIVSVVKKK